MGVFLHFGNVEVDNYCVTALNYCFFPFSSFLSFLKSAARLSF